ncbi:hypothetical protein ACVWXU_006185 [Streptomyces sp. TE33382]
MRDDHGDIRTGDAVILAAGAWLGGIGAHLDGYVDAWKSATGS